MNFFSAEVAGDTLKTPFGDVPLPDAPQARRRLGERQARRWPACAPSPSRTPRSRGDQNRRGGHEFEADVDLTESMGSEVYAYLG